jgi:sec-independent protein translocase protein TatA
MKFGGLGLPELIIILVVALVIFGPKNLPKLGAALGKTVKGVREGLEGKDKLDPADADVVELEEDEEVVDTPTGKTKRKVTSKNK